MLTRICNACGKEKSIDYFSQNGLHIYSHCKECKNLRTAMRRYNITLQQAKKFFATKTCNCCGGKFTNKNPRHIHHIDNNVKVLCQKCNLILGQETNEDLHRIKSCLKFIYQNRENFSNRDNQQGSLSDPSTTARSPRKNEYVCKKCNRLLHKSAFRVDRKWRRKTCKHCEVCLESARQFNISYELAFKLYSKESCDCCHLPFTSKNKVTIHHIKNDVLGATCDACNRRLGQETLQQISHLQACETWIQDAMMVQSDLCGNIES